MKTWFKNLKRSAQSALIFALIASMSIGAYAAVSFLWGKANEKTALTPGDFVKVELTGAAATGSVSPGENVALYPAITNNGSVDTSAFIQIEMPAVEGTAAYTFESDSGWTMVDEIITDNISSQIWAYGSNGNLESISPGSSTSALMKNGITMRSDITGVQFANMSDVNLDTYGYLVDYTVGTDPETVWYMIPGNE